MAKDNTPVNKDGFDFSGISNRIDSPDKLPPPDPSDTIKNGSRPVKSPKTKKGGKSAATDTPQPNITNKIASEFAASSVEASASQRDASDTAKIKSIVLSNIASDISQSKAISRIWLPRVKSMLPSSLYGKVNSLLPDDIKPDAKGNINAGAINARLVKILTDQQQLSIDQYIRNKSDEMIKDKITQYHHVETKTILSQILSMTRRNNTFLETTLKKYMMTSIELKFKHIFVTKDILKYTKIMLNTLGGKLETVKHNTSIPDDAKISLFGEAASILKSRIGAIAAYSLSGPLKRHIDAFLGTQLEKAKEYAIAKYQDLGEIGPIEYGRVKAHKGDTLKSKSKYHARSIISKARELAGHANQDYGRADMSTGTIDQPESGRVRGHVEGIIRKVLPGKQTRSFIESSLSKQGTDQASFDVITRRAIIDIIPGFLAKIHHESSTISKMINFSIKEKLPKRRHAAFASKTATDELIYDRQAEDFVSGKKFIENAKERVFGTKDERTEKIKPMIKQLHAGFKQHGGDDAEFKDALPEIVQFVNNVSKHAKVVKLEHIKQYLNGEKLSEQEQDYMEAILVDIPKTSRKRLVKILGTTFFKDKSHSQVDAEVAKSIGHTFQKHIDEKARHAQKLDELGEYGDNRHMPEIYDTKTGKLKHKAIRAIHSDVDFDALRAGVVYQSRGMRKRHERWPFIGDDFEQAHQPAERTHREKAEDLYHKAKSKADTVIKKVRKKSPPPVPGTPPLPKKKQWWHGLNEKKDEIVAHFNEALKPETIHTASHVPGGVPNKDTPHVSGPGVYIQGVDKELHVPLVDTVKGKLHTHFESASKAANKAAENLNKHIHKAIDDHKARKTTHTPTIKAAVTSRLERANKTMNESAEKLSKHIHGKIESHKKDKIIKDYQDHMIKLLSRQFNTMNKADEVKIHLSTQLLGKTGGALYQKGMAGIHKIPGMLRSAKDKLIGDKEHPGILHHKALIGTLAKKGAAAYANVTKKIIGVQARVAGGVLGGAYRMTKNVISAALRNKFVDVYKKDHVKIGSPLLQGTLIKEGHYIYENGDVVKDSYSIKEPVFDKETKQLAVTDEDIKAGLVDNKNRSLKKMSFLKAGGLLKSGLSLAGKGIKLYFDFYKGLFNLAGKAVGGGKDILLSLISKIPGLKSIKGAFSRSDIGKKLDTKTVHDLITRHLIRITHLLKPITKHFDKSFKFEDEHEEAGHYGHSGTPSPVAKAKTTLKEKVKAGTSKAISGTKSILASGARKVLDHPKVAAATAGTGLIGKGLHHLKTKLSKKKEDGKKEEDEKKGDEKSDGTATTLAEKAGKKTVSKAKEGVKKVLSKTAKKEGGSLLKSAAGTAVGSLIGGEVVGGGLGATILGSLPEITMGALFLGAEMFAKYEFNKNLSKLKNIFSSTKSAALQIRNEIYKVPKGKLSTLDSFEEDVDDNIDNIDDDKRMKDILEKYCAKFGFDSKKPEELTFFMYWYKTAFSPTFKYTHGILRSQFKLKFKNIADMTSEQLELYTRLVKDSVYYKAKGVTPELSPEGCKMWVSTNKPKSDEEKKKEEDAKKKPEDIKKGMLATAGDKIKSMLGFGTAAATAVGATGTTSSTEVSHSESSNTAQMSGVNSLKNPEKAREMFGSMGNNVPKKGEYGGPTSAIPKATPKNEYTGPTPVASATDATINSKTSNTSPGASPGIVGATGAAINPVEKGTVGPKPGPINVPKKVGSKLSAGHWSAVEGPIIAKLKSLGWSEAQAIGLAANIKQESGGDHTASGDHGHAYGIGQWQGPRQRAFEEKFKHPIQQSTIDEQLEFMDFELRNHKKGGEGAAGDALMKAKTADEAGAIVSRKYERPGSTEERRAFEAASRGASAKSMAARISKAPPIENIASAVPGTQNAGPSPAGDTTASATTPAAGSSPTPAVSPTDVTTPGGTTNLPIGIASLGSLSPTPPQQSSTISNIQQSASITKAPSPIATAPPPALSPGGVVSVNDPESKKQTDLLTQQNALLSNIAKLLGTDKGGGDQKAVLAKLDGVISAVKSSGGPGSDATASNGGNTNESRTSTSNSGNFGIDVSRSKVPA